MEPKDSIKKMRNDMKLNRKEFCERFNIPYRTVQDWECGKRVMPEYVLRLLEYKIRMEQMLQEQHAKHDMQIKIDTNDLEENCAEKDFLICHMCEKDYKQVYQLWISCTGVGLNEIDDSESGIAKFLLRNPKTCFVAKVNEKVVGVILAGHDGRRGYIYHLAVAEEYRGKGIARKLVDYAMDELDNLGIQKVALVVFADNEEGNHFWERIGFTVRDDLIYRNKIIKN